MDDIEAIRNRLENPNISISTYREDIGTLLAKLEEQGKKNEGGQQGNVVHHGIWHERTEPDYGYREKVFADRWEAENELDSCTKPTLSCLVNKEKGSFRHVTQRNAEVAATVIQWLGTNVGHCFLMECEKEIAKIRQQRN